MEWNVYYYSINGDEIKCFNIFCHGRFLKDLVKNLKKRHKKEEFKEELRRDIMYYFWSKSEWELLVSLKQENAQKDKLNFGEFAQQVKMLARNSKVTKTEFDEFLCQNLLPSSKILLEPWIGRRSFTKEVSSKEFFMKNLDVYSEMIRKLAKKRIDNEVYEEVLKSYMPCACNVNFNWFKTVFENGASLDNEKIDVYNQMMVNFNLFADYVLANKKKLIEMYNEDRF